jgi:hypothetical protein
VLLNAKGGSLLGCVAVAAGAAGAILLDVLAVEEGQQEELERRRLLGALARFVEQVVGHVGVKARQQRRLPASAQGRGRCGRGQAGRRRVVKEEREAGDR